MQPALSNIWKIPQGMKKPLRKIFVCKIFTLRKVVKSTFNNFKYKLKIKLANIGLFEVFVHRLQIFSYIRPLAFQVTICMQVCMYSCYYLYWYVLSVVDFIYFLRFIYYFILVICFISFFVTSISCALEQQEFFELSVLSSLFHSLLYCKLVVVITRKI